MQTGIVSVGLERSLKGRWNTHVVDDPSESSHDEEFPLEPIVVSKISS